MSVVLSYSRRDSQIADFLYRFLDSKGYRVWMDRWNIPPGSPWDDTIQSAIQNASHVAVILSPASVASQNVSDEWSYALEKDKKVIPIYYQETEVPMRLRRFQRVDFEQHFAVMFSELLNALGTPDLRTEDRSQRPEARTEPDPRPHEKSAVASSLLRDSPGTMAEPVQGPLAATKTARQRRSFTVDIRIAFLFVLVILLLAGGVTASIAAKSWIPVQPVDRTFLAAIPVASVSQDTGEYAWKSGDSDEKFPQKSSPELVQETVGDINGTFLKYPVVLRSFLNSDRYNDPVQLARFRRRLRGDERGKWNTLIATMYVASKSNTNVYVIPYFITADSKFVTIGFGQTIPTNRWIPVIWKEVLDTTVYDDPTFFEAISALQKKYNIKYTDLPRLVSLGSMEKKADTLFGFSFKMLSDGKPGEEDTLEATIYTSGLTFLTQ